MIQKDNDTKHKFCDKGRLIMIYDDNDNLKKMINGNMNRMCITDDLKELYQMRNWIMKRADKMVKINRKRIVNNIIDNS
jgi:acyl-coenzyme A synthetase/AMP-(fatty) acid ligase